MRNFMAAAFAVCVAVPVAAQDLPSLRMAAQLTGTVNWELQTILHRGLDTANGFDLELMDVSGSSAGQVAFQGGEADVIVSDWIRVARQRADGQDVQFLPYSKAVGGVMVLDDSSAQSLADLKGEQNGIAGGPVDKSWIILQALARKQGFDLAAETTQVFGAPPLIYKAALDGETAAAVNFWHFLAKQQLAGMRVLVSVADAAQELGLDPNTPLLGYAFHGETLREPPELIEGLAAASRAAKRILATDDAEWDRL